MKRSIGQIFSRQEKFCPFTQHVSLLTLSNPNYNLNLDMSPYNAAFLRFTCCSDLRYCERLANLELDRLELRQMRFDLTYCMCIKYFLLWSKQMHQFFFRVYNTSTVTRGHRLSLKLFMPQSRSDVPSANRPLCFLSPELVHCWKSLPAQPDDFSSLNEFKRLLSRADLSGFISCIDRSF